MTTENIYICTVRKGRHNNHKVMYSLKVFFFYFYTEFSTCKVMINMSINLHIYSKSHKTFNGIEI